MNTEVKCEIYSRVVGYYRPLDNWNNGKKEEYNERVEFDEEKIILSQSIQEND